MCQPVHHKSFNEYLVRCNEISLLQAFRLSGIEVRSDCNGRGTCGKCRVRIKKGLVTPLTIDERKHLDETEIAAGIRLACQTKACTDDKVIVEVTPCQPIEKTGGSEDQVISDCLARNARRVGIAIDLGTTTIAGFLVDLDRSKTLAIESIRNPQIVYGSDVMSRIRYAQKNDGALLQRVVVDALNQLIMRLTRKPGKISEMTIVGNTIMHHLLLGLPIEQLGRYPYRPATKDPVDVKAENLGLCISSSAPVHMLPNVSGFIGSDHIAMLVAAGIHKIKKTVLGLDIGTNTEVILSHRAKLTSTSCASGPALEGGHIRHGIGAVRGAIKHVIIKNTGITIQTINNAAPVGLCGSGVIDAVAECIRNGIIDRRGHFNKHPSVIREGGIDEFVLVSKAKSGTGRHITLTQHDIQEIQLAKAAIRTGIEILLSETGINWDAIDRVVLTGGFGTSISLHSAIILGIFPPLPGTKFKRIENAAGMGAKLFLTSCKLRQEAAQISSHISHCELATHPDFVKTFSSCLSFP